MNYIQELNSFYDWTETNPMPASAINLWHALMQINNKCRWNAEFTAAISTLMAKTSCQRRSIFSARKILADYGRLVWTSNGSQKSATYRLIPFSPENENTHSQGVKSDKDTPENPPDQNNDQNNNQSNNQNTPLCKDQNKIGPGSCTEHDTQAAPISKHKQKGKLNSIKEAKASMSSGDDPDESVENILDDFNQFCKNLPQAKVLTEKRKRMVMARLHEHGYQNILLMLRNAGASNFLAGDNQRQWTATFDWLFRPANFAKVLEGNYANKLSAKRDKSEFIGKPSPLELIEEAYNGIMKDEYEY